MIFARCTPPDVCGIPVRMNDKVIGLRITSTVAPLLHEERSVTLPP